MQFKSDSLYHIYNRGNNKKRIFYHNDNYIFFLQKIRNHLKPHCHILAYCLMPNHFHLLIKTFDNDNGQEISKAIGIILRSYTQVINKKQNSVGSVFQQKTKAKYLEATYINYPFICFNYIHQNPLKAGIVNRLENWDYSSFKDYVGLRKGTLCDKELARQILDLPPNPLEFYKLAYLMISDDLVSNFL